MDSDKIKKLLSGKYVTQTGMIDSNGDVKESMTSMDEDTFLKAFLTQTGLYEGSDSSTLPPDDPDVNYTYSEPIVSLEYPEVSAEGGSIEPTYSYSQDWEGDDGSSGTIINEGGTLVFTSDALAIDESTGVVTVDANETTVSKTLGEVTLTVTMNEKTGNATTIIAQAAGETQKVSVSNVEELKEALESGSSNIVIDADLTASESINITSDAVIDLNGHTLTREDDTSACAMFIISDGTIEFAGSGTVQSNGTSTSDWVQALWVNGENATVNLSGDIAWKGGIWNNLEDTTTGSSACVYCEYGTINIYAGSYECGYAVDMEQYSVLNCLNSSYNAGTAHINVYGGTFKNFNPADNTSEGSGTNFVVNGCVSNETSDGIWVVSSDVDSVNVLNSGDSATKKSKKKSKKS